MNLYIQDPLYPNSRCEITLSRYQPRREEFTDFIQAPLKKELDD